MSSNLIGQFDRMKSSMVEQRFVKPLVESSNLSSSAIVSATKLESRSGL